MSNLKLDFEKIILAVFFAILLYIGPGAIFDHRIMHEFPYGYFASDTFQHQVRAEAIKDAGNFRYEAPYISLGFEKVIGRYPPIIYHLSVIFSYLAGIEVYDSIYFIVFFFAIFAALIMYLIVKDFNKNVALMSLPLAILMFSNPLSVGFLWGHWPSLLSQFFLVLFFWCIMRAELKKSYMITAIALTSITLTHTSEAIFALLFLAIFFVIRLINRDFKKNEIRNIIIAFVIFLIVSSYYLIIFKNTWAKAQPYSFAVEPVWKGNPGFYIMDFGLLLVFIAAGILFSLFKLRSMHISLLLAFAMLLGGFLNYIGFGLRSFQIRFFWPIYLSVFFGFGIYALLKLVLKKWNMAYTLAISIIFTVLLTGIIKVPYMPNYSNVASPQGLMDTYHWSALKWLSKNTEADSKIYFFYGDIYSQDALLRNSKRIHYQVDPDDFVKAIKDKKINRYYVSELPGDSGGAPSTRTGLFSFEEVTKTKPKGYFFGPQDICKFDYIVFDMPRNERDIKVYNIVIKDELLKKDFIKQVYENGASFILQNGKPGSDCIEERNF